MWPISISLQTDMRKTQADCSHIGAAQAIQAAQFTAIPIKQNENWVRLARPKERLCGLTRSHLYQLCACGLVRSISIRQPHRQRGVRLVFRPSLHAFLAKLDAEQNGEG